MATYIPLGKIPKSPEERTQLLAKQVETEEYLSQVELTHIQRLVIDFLISKKGYLAEDIEINRFFNITLPDICFNVNADVVVKSNEKRLLVIKCAINSLESWERHSIAFGRAAGHYQIPYAIVTDGKIARLLDVTKGQLIASGGIDELMPSKEKIQKMAEEVIFMPYSENRSEKEKRILYAFDAIRYSVSFCETEK